MTLTCKRSEFYWEIIRRKTIKCTRIHFQQQQKSTTESWKQKNISEKVNENYVLHIQKMHLCYKKTSDKKQIKILNQLYRRIWAKEEFGKRTYKATTLKSSEQTTPNQEQ